MCFFVFNLLIGKYFFMRVVSVYRLLVFNVFLIGGLF